MDLHIHRLASHLPFSTDVYLRDVHTMKQTASCMKAAVGTMQSRREI
jgi:hypothetical protein